MPAESPPTSSFRDQLKLPPYSRALWVAGLSFALEAALCSAILWTGYAWFGFEGARWAVVSSIVVLQPGVTQSFQASVFRIAANLIGAVVGLLAATSLGTSPWQVILAMLAVIFCCLLLRLEQSLRSACVSVIIVMTVGDGQVATNAIQRATGVAIGATLAVAVQLLFETLLRSLRKKYQAMPASTPSTIQAVAVAKHEE